MQNAKFGKRSYVSASSDGDGDDPGGGRRGNLGAQARSEGINLQREAAKKKFYFQQKMALEGKRKALEKGNSVTFLLADAKQGVEHNDVNKILRVGGFTPDEVIAIKLKDFRTNQVEVLFKSDTEVDTLKVEEKIRKGGVDVVVSKFDHVEDFLIIYGLPVTENTEVLKEKILDSITPFVKRVLDIAPCTHRGTTQDDFFNGKFDGNWRLKVIPRRGIYIPNFVVIGNDVMGKAVNTKRIGDKEEMCSECYKTGHYRKDCSGQRSWSDYCKEFKELWENLINLNMEEEEVDEHETNDETSVVSRLRKSEKERIKHRA